MQVTGSAWLWMALAIIFEVMGTTSMKLAEGFTRTAPSIAVFVFYGLCFAALTLALRNIELSVAYAVWSGVGIALTTLIGVAWFGETMGFLKMVSITCIVAGVVGVHVASRAGH